MSRPHHITIDGNVLPVIIRKRARSRCIVIRYQPLQHHVSLTLPRYASIKQGLDFLEDRRAWLTRQIGKQPQSIPFSNDQVIPVLGVDYVLTHVGGRGVTSAENGTLLVYGDAGFMERRVLEWVKKTLLTEVKAYAALQAQRIDKTIQKISLRDTGSRWGSCSWDGNLSFSWRLAFAPLDVLHYVICHEVAHLKHHDHSPAFWKTVADLCPEHEKAQYWLKAHGTSLYAYGAAG